MVKKIPNFLIYIVLSVVWLIIIDPTSKTLHLSNSSLPKFPNLIPKHYYYKFQKNFAIAGIENLKVLNQKIDQRIKNVKLYEKYLIDDLKLNIYDFYN